MHSLVVNNYVCYEPLIKLSYILYVTNHWCIFQNIFLVSSQTFASKLCKGPTITSPNCNSQTPRNMYYSMETKPQTSFLLLKTSDSTTKIMFFRGCTSGGVYVPCMYTHGRWLRSLLLYFCYVFRALINSPVCWFLSPCVAAIGLARHSGKLGSFTTDSWTQVSLMKERSDASD